MRRLALSREPVAEPEHLLAVRDEASEKLAVHLPAAESAPCGRTGHESGDRLARIRHRVAQKEPAQALPPSVVGRLRQVFFAPVRLVHPPADAGFPYEVANGGEIGFADPEPGPDRRRRERREDRLRAVP